MDDLMHDLRAPWGYVNGSGAVMDANGLMVADVFAAGRRSEFDALIDQRGHVLAASAELLAAAHGVLRMLDAYRFGDVPAREVEALRAAVTKGYGE